MKKKRAFVISSNYGMFSYEAESQSKAVEMYEAEIKAMQDSMRESLTAEQQDKLPAFKGVRRIR